MNQDAPFRPELMLPRLISGLIVTELEDDSGEVATYFVKHPMSGEVFRFGPKEYFIAACLTGETSAAEVQALFVEKFQMQCRIEDIIQTVDLLSGCGLFWSCRWDDFLLEEDETATAGGTHCAWCASALLDAGQWQERRKQARKEVWAG